MKDSDRVLGCIGMVLVIVLMVVIGSLMNGWALSILWKWFVIPIFTLPSLSIIQAIGVSMVVGILTSHSSTIDSSKEWTEIINTYIGRAIVYPIMVVGIGWIVSSML